MLLRMRRALPRPSGRQYRQWRQATNRHGVGRGQRQRGRGRRAGSANVGEAVARAGAAFELAGAPALAPHVRQLLLDRLDGRGRRAEPSRAWLEPAVAALSEPDRAAGRLVLPTAFASYQLIPQDVADFQATNPRDEALVGPTAWASFAVARRIRSRQRSATLAATG